jgi:hypothetical protein
LYKTFFCCVCMWSRKSLFLPLDPASLGDTTSSQLSLATYMRLILSEQAVYCSEVLSCHRVRILAYRMQLEHRREPLDPKSQDRRALLCLCSLAWSSPSLLSFRSCCRLLPFSVCSVLSLSALVGLTEKRQKTRCSNLKAHHYCPVCSKPLRTKAVSTSPVFCRALKSRAVGFAEISKNKVPHKERSEKGGA